MKQRNRKQMQSGIKRVNVFWYMCQEKNENVFIKPRS